MKPPNLTFYGGRGHTTTNFPLPLLNLNKILKNSTPGKVACVWHIEQVQIDAIKFERTQIHLFYRRFHCRRRRPCLSSLLLVCAFLVYPLSPLCCPYMLTTRLLSHALIAPLQRSSRFMAVLNWVLVLNLPLVNVRVFGWVRCVAVWMRLSPSSGQLLWLTF